MKKFILPLFIVLIVFIGIKFLFPNSSSLNAKKTLVEKSLNQKYGEQFVLDRIGGDLGELPSNTNKGYAYNTKTPKKLFRVQINKKTNEVVDNYMDVVMEDKANNEFSGILSQIYKNDFILVTRYDSKWSPHETTNFNIMPKDYFLRIRYINNGIYILLDQKDINDKKAVDDIFKDFADKIGIDYPNSNIEYGICEEGEYNQIKEDKSLFYDREAQEAIFTDHCPINGSIALGDSNY